MTKLKALIVDDEPLAHEIVVDYLNEIEDVEIASQCYSAIDAMAYLKQHPVDIVFLDINMPRLSGVELLKVLTIESQVIITSAYRQYALESFELEVCDYLLKPFRFERFLKAVNKAQTQIQLIRQRDELNEETQAQAYTAKDKCLTIKVDKSLHKISITDICYLEAYGNYVKVGLENQVLMTLRTLSSFEGILVPDYPTFVRIHKSYIINKNFIQTVEPRQVKLTNGKELAIGKSFRQLARELV